MSSTRSTPPATWFARYTQGLSVDEPLALLRSGTTSYYQADGLGSITSLTNSSGSLVSTYTYDAFGQLTASSGSIVNPYRFTGREWDQEFGAYYYRARTYDPRLGRFLTQDPIRFAGGINVYIYVTNNPSRWIDPAGLLTASERNQIIATWGLAGSILGFLGGGGAGLLTGPGAVVASPSGATAGAAGGGALGVALGTALANALDDDSHSGGSSDTGSAEECKRPDLNNLSDKIRRQMRNRGWTPEQIQEAFDTGDSFDGVNRLGGANSPATRYVNPTTGQSVVIDNATGEVIHVGGPGFMY